MTRKELNERVKKRLKGNWKKSIKAVLIFYGVCISLGLIVEIVEDIIEVSDYVTLLSNVILTLIILPSLTLGFINYFIKIAKGENPRYNELFSKMNPIKSFPLFLISIFCFPANYILLDEPNIKAKDAIKKGKEMIRGHKMDYLVLCLKYIVGIILSICSLGIGALWVLPYIAVNDYIFYESIKKAS